MTVSLFYNFNYTFNLAITYVVTYIITYFKTSLNLFTNFFKNNNKLFIYKLLFLTSIIISGYYSSLVFIYKNIIFYSYWFILGVLSTIGIGFGLQTGVIFVVPYVIDIYNTECNLIDCNYTKILDIYIICLPVVIFWAIGSAFGELPPYFLAKNSQIDIFPTTSSSFKDKMINKIINLVKNKLRQNSFITIVIFSCWPSITFDMCGLLCGYYKFSIKEFLIPTIIGKAFIKTPVLLAVVLYFYHTNTEFIENDNTKTLLSYIPIVIITIFIKTSIEKCANNQLKLKKK